MLGSSDCANHRGLLNLDSAQLHELIQFFFLYWAAMTSTARIWPCSYLDMTTSLLQNSDERFFGPVKSIYVQQRRDTQIR
jgi:hypothetical protein